MMVVCFKYVSLLCKAHPLCRQSPPLIGFGLMKISAVGARSGYLSRLIAVLVGSLCLAFVGLAAYTNVSTDLTPDDVKVFNDIGLKKPSASLTFEAELS